MAGRTISAGREIARLGGLRETEYPRAAPIRDLPACPDFFVLNPYSPVTWFGVVALGLLALVAWWQFEIKVIAWVLVVADVLFVLDAIAPIALLECQRAAGIGDLIREITNVGP